MVKLLLYNIQENKGLFFVFFTFIYLETGKEKFKYLLKNAIIFL